MYFLQKDDIMLHFTLSGSTGCQCLLSYLLSCLLFFYLESVAGLKLGLKFGLKFGFKFGFKLNLNWKVSLKCFFEKMSRFP